MEAPLAYRIDSAKGLAVVTYRVQPAFEEWATTLNRLLTDPAFRPHFGVLFDRRSVSHPVTPEYIRKIIRFLDEKQTAHKMGHCATVVSDIASYGMGRMAEQISTIDESFRTFRTLHEAEQWLAGFNPPT